MDTPRTLRAVRWYFDGGPTHDGWTDGTTWNGWPNVWVTPATRDLLAAEADADDDTETAAELRAKAPDASGLISLAYGYTPNIEQEG